MFDNLLQNIANQINEAHAKGECDYAVVPFEYAEEFRLNLDTMDGDDMDGHIAWYLNTHPECRETLGKGFWYHKNCLSLCNLDACDLGLESWKVLSRKVAEQLNETLYVTHLYDPEQGENYKVHLRSLELFWETGYNEEVSFDNLPEAISSYLDDLG